MSAVGPLPDSCIAAKFVGADNQRWGDDQAERPGGLEINDQLEFSGSLYRQVAGTGTFQDFVNVSRSTPEQVEALLSVSWTRPVVNAV